MNQLLGLFGSPSKRKASASASLAATRDLFEDDLKKTSSAKPSSPRSEMDHVSLYEDDSAQEDDPKAADPAVTTSRSSRRRASTSVSSASSGDTADEQEDTKKLSRKSAASTSAAPASQTRASVNGGATSRLAATQKRGAAANGAKKQQQIPASPNKQSFDIVIPTSAKKRGPPRTAAASKKLKDSDDDEEIVKPVKKRPRRSTAEYSVEPEADEESTPRKRGRSRSHKGVDSKGKGVQTAAGKTSTKKRKTKTESSGWSPAPLEELADPDRSRMLQSIELTNELDERAGVRVGDAIELAGSSDPQNEPWLAKIQAIGGRTEDFEDLLDEDGNPVTHPSGNISKALHTPWFQCSWLYSRSSFVALKGKNAQRWSASVLAPLGEREYIETDHTDWVQRDELDVAWYDDLQQNLRAVERKSSAATVYKFDDLYPGTPAVESPARHPLQPFRPRVKREPKIEVPSYYWGDNTGSDDDESDTDSSFYVRVSFGFGGKKTLQQSGIEQQYPTSISFNKHSSSRKAYNPTHVQVFNQTSKKWFDVTDLKKNKHYAPVNLARDFAALEPSDSDTTDYDDPPSAKGKEKAVSHQDKGKKKATLSADTTLRRLAKSQIIRGGAYGLIGNSYLVTRAAQLLEIIDEEDDEEEMEEAEEEGRRLVEDEAEWKRGSEERKKLGLEAGEAPKGYQWAPPSQ